MPDITLTPVKRKGNVMLKSTRKRAVSKPHPDFPLFPHATGRWAKKVKGKFAYFGKVADDPNGQAALVLWLKQKDNLLAGRTPQTKPEGLDLRELLDRYVVAKRARVDSGEITPRTFNELFTCCKRIGDVLGLDRLVVNLVPDDFSKLRRAIAKIWGPTRLGNEVQRVRSVFKFGYESRLIDRPVLFGPEFKKPSAKTLRLNRPRTGNGHSTAEQLRAIIAKAGPQVKAMVLLGINCGFGNGDCAKLPLGPWISRAAGLPFPGRRLESSGGYRSGPKPWPRSRWPSLSGRSRRTRPMPRSCSLRSTAGRGTSRPLLKSAKTGS